MFAPCTKKASQHLGRLFGFHTTYNLEAMIEPLVASDVEECLTAASFGIVTSKNEARDTSVHKRPSTHGTRLKGDVKCGVV